MQVNPINNYQSNYFSPNFGVNLQSKKLRFKNEDFFVKIKGYGTNSDWAKIVINTADTAVNFIRTNLDFESILKFITSGVTKANQIPADIEKRAHTGILRVKRKDWKFGSNWKYGYIITHYDGTKSKYKIYKDRLDKVAKYPIYNPFCKFMLTRPVNSNNYGKFLEHAEPKYINHSLDMVSDLYNKLHEKYIANKSANLNLDDINSTIAEMRWILAHATPWERGSDAISNTFIRSVYKAMGIKTSPLKKGISLDLEAYCTNLTDYQTKFETYFVKKPYIVE